MANVLGKIKAPPKTTTPPGAGEPPAPADSSLPDPTKYAKHALLWMLLAALAVALIWNGLFHVAGAFKPSADEAANFAFFAGFYAAAQVIERMLELGAPLLPWWDVPAPEVIVDQPVTDAAQTEVQRKTAEAAQLKADRAVAVHGVAAVLGVAVSCGFGLFFLQTVGFHVSNTIDTFATGVLISAGTKPLHDAITGLQNRNTPTTGTAT